MPSKDRPATHFSEVYSIYYKQINHILHGKSEMWSMGFRNGLISSTDLSKRDSFMVHMASDYELGFQEGFSYAIYKLALHKPKVLTPSPSYH